MPVYLTLSRLLFSWDNFTPKILLLMTKSQLSAHIFVNKFWIVFFFLTTFFIDTFLHWALCLSITGSLSTVWLYCSTSHLAMSFPTSSNSVSWRNYYPTVHCHFISYSWMCLCYSHYAALEVVYFLGRTLQAELCLCLAPQAYHNWTTGASWVSTSTTTLWIPRFLIFSSLLLKEGDLRLKWTTSSEVSKVNIRSGNCFHLIKRILPQWSWGTTTSLWWLNTVNCGH